MRPTRRRFFGSMFAVFAPLACNLSVEGSASDPWSAEDLVQPETLAKVLASPGGRPAIICVAFPVLYRQKHITGAKFAGPASKVEGMAALKQLVEPLPHKAAIVLYCGCCPMVRCPNIRPAFQTLKELGYTDARVLNLPSNFRADWEDKGYSVSSQS
jgi:thiosulfate/3-mercaptopyruvate sulfurtransferase